MEPIKLVPVPGDPRKGLGLYDEDLNLIGAKDGDWVGIKYGEKEESAQVYQKERVEGSERWPDKLIWIDKTLRSRLNLTDIDSTSPTKPPKNHELTVWKHFFPKGQRVYAAIVTFVLTVFGALFSAAGEFLPKSDPLQIPLGLGVLIVVLIGAGGALASVILQKQ